MTATGVQFERFGITYTVNANTDVVLTAGAINSPAILMKSGIGQKKLLKKLDIPLVKDLPVGQNLRDQVSTEISLKVPKNTVTNVYKNMNLLQFLKYILFGEGLLSTAPVEMIGYLNVNNASDSDAVPDVQITIKPFSLVSDSGFKSALGINEKLWQNMEKNKNDKDTFAIEVKLLHPKSVGTVEVTSLSPMKYKINPKYYTESEDIQTMIKALEFVYKIIDSSPLKAHRLQTFGEPIDCAKLKPKSSESFECYARHITLSGHSPIGTCRMGDEHSEGSVVDPQLSVIGVNGLRVADASVMPSHTSGGSMAPVLMIGQKVANIYMEKEGQKFKEKFDRVSDMVDQGFQMAYKFVSKYYGL